jgi:hypothetical protein
MGWRQTAEPGVEVLPFSAIPRLEPGTSVEAIVNADLRDKTKPVVFPLTCAASPCSYAHAQSARPSQHSAHTFTHHLLKRIHICTVTHTRTHRDTDTQSPSRGLSPTHTLTHSLACCWRMPGRTAVASM